MATSVVAATVRAAPRAASSTIVTRTTIRTIPRSSLLLTIEIPRRDVDENLTIGQVPFHGGGRAAVREQDSRRTPQRSTCRLHAQRHAYPANHEEVGVEHARGDITGRPGTVLQHRGIECHA